MAINYSVITFNAAHFFNGGGGIYNDADPSSVTPDGQPDQLEPAAELRADQHDRGLLQLALVAQLHHETAD